LLTVALANGRLLPEIGALLHRAQMPPLEQTGERRLLLLARAGGLTVRYLLARPADVTLYVGSGVAELGVTGSDMLAEEDHGCRELASLGIGHCRLSVCGPAALSPEWPRLLRLGDRLRVGTRYPAVAKQYFTRLGVTPAIIALSGSVELAPLTGLADVIVDLVATGRTLRENDLVEYALIQRVSARLIAAEAGRCRGTAAVFVDRLRRGTDRRTSSE